MPTSVQVVKKQYHCQNLNALKIAILNLNQAMMNSLPENVKLEVIFENKQV